MKTILYLLLMAHSITLNAQIITPQIKSNFGIDADLKANFFNGFVSNGDDEWFSSGNAGAGVFVIDTTGAAAIVSGYTNQLEGKANQTHIRNMSYPVFSVVNNEMLIDAVFVRDYHGDDSTMFASGSNKNGQNPLNWSTPVSQSIPDKNEILDVFMHVRRAGTSATDSLWMFGAISIENITGNRYFDFEMYQTDILYNRSSRTFSGYGPDAGHTSWKFDAAGNILQAGDIILTAEYGSSSLTLIEPRIWIDKNSLLITPKGFNWAGQFDGAGAAAQFGYASILPKTAGAFYSGLQSTKETWGGPFGVMLGNNTLLQNYTARQFMEFSVNLSKLGLDPVTLLGGSTCDRPFQRVLIKTRASTSFTSELKDFVAPFTFLDIPKVKLFTEIPVFCGVYAVSNLVVKNPIATSVYSWSTVDGHIADSTNKTSIYVDAPGTYIVTQKLRPECPIYSSDTIKITFEINCGILNLNNLNFKGKQINNLMYLSWNKLENELIDYYEIERSINGIHFNTTQKKLAQINTELQLSTTDELTDIVEPFIYYRLKIISPTGAIKFSNIIKIKLKVINQTTLVSIAPNPATDYFSVYIQSAFEKTIQIKIFDCYGKLIRKMNTTINQGSNNILFNDIQHWQKGFYSLQLFFDKESISQKFILK